MQTKTLSNSRYRFERSGAERDRRDERCSNDVFRTPNGGCHSLWVLGHLTLVEGMIPAGNFSETRIRKQSGTILW